MHESPRIRRLRSDLAALERLRDESSVLRFRATGNPVQHYLDRVPRQEPGADRGGRSVDPRRHEVEIKLGASYPRTMPEIRWLTPIYHPNISEIGMVCLGGYGTHWVPSLNLDELCVMLWDMARYHNYDIRSPYNRDAALWVANQTTLPLPDRRPAAPRPPRRARAGRVRARGDADPQRRPRIDATERRPGASTAERPGSKAGRYAEFVRKFAADLHSITPPDRQTGPAPAAPWRAARA